MACASVVTTVEFKYESISVICTVSISSVVTTVEFKYHQKIAVPIRSGCFSCYYSRI